MFIIEGTSAFLLLAEINTGMLKMDVFVDFSLTTEASLLFVRTPCIDCYGGRVVLYVAIFTGMLEVRR